MHRPATDDAAPNTSKARASRNNLERDASAYPARRNADGDASQADADRRIASEVATSQNDIPTTANGSLTEECDVPAAHRLHFATLWLPMLEVSVRSAVPLAIASLFLPFGSTLFYFASFGLSSVAIYHVLQYLTVRYRFTNEALVLTSGLLFHRERRIPFDRVQELEIQQGAHHRILGLARVGITTAGSDVREVHLSVLSQTAAMNLQHTIRGTKPNKACGATSSTLRSQDHDFVHRTSLRDLILGGLTSRLVASLGAVLAAFLYFQGFVGIGNLWWVHAAQERGAHGWNAQSGLDRLFDHVHSLLPDFGPLNALAAWWFLNDTLAKSLTFVAIGLLGSVIAYVVRYHAFSLTRNGDLLATSCGLLTRRHGNLPRHRIQALKIDEGLLRRWIGMVAIRVDSAGDRQEVSEANKRDVLMPIVPKVTAQRIAQQALPELPAWPSQWNRVSRRAILRGTKKGWLVVLLGMLQTFGIAGWYCWALVPAFPIVYFLNYQWYQNIGYWLDDQYFLSRKGWLNRETTCLPINNIQNVSVRQSFLDRRMGLAVLSIDTAGQSNTGGGPVIRHLPLAEARYVQRLLSQKICDA